MTGFGTITNNKSLSFCDYGSSGILLDLNSSGRTCEQMKELAMFNQLNPVPLSTPHPPSLNDASGATKCCPEEKLSLGKSIVTQTAPKLIMPLAAALLAVIGLSLPARADEHTIAWDYDQVALELGMTNENARVWFRLYYTQDPSIPLTNWIVLPATTNTIMKVDVPRTWGFFALNASNYLGVAWCLNQTNIPAPVLSNYVIRVIKP